MAEKGDEYRKDEVEDEDEEEEVDEAGYKTVKDAVLFAIHVNESMLTPSKSGETATLAALKCAYALMQQRIISNPKDMMGILLFGTEQSKFQDFEMSGTGTIQYPHCYLLSDLDVPAATDVKRLRSLVEDENESQKLLVPSKEPVTMSNVLFCANQIFTTRAPNFSSRRLFLVTDDDNPHANNKDLRSSATVRAKDLFDLGVTIELFPISRPDQDFDRAKFYDDIVYRSGPTDPEAPAPISTRIDPLSGKDGISLLTALLTSVNSRSVPRRALFSNIPLELTPNVKISVKGYIIYKHQEPQRSCYIWLDGETPQIATGITTRSAESEVFADTAAPPDKSVADADQKAGTRKVETSEIRKAFKFGGENVTFTPEELTSLRTLGDPVIRIIGFKDRSLLPPWANLKTSTFIYPSEDEYVGSTRTFSALHQTLLKKKKIGIVWYIARRNAAPVVAALIPGEEKLGANNEQTQAPGLWIVPIPYADDIRQPPDSTGAVEAPIELVEKMKAVIQLLQMPKGKYDPARFPNPSLQWHYRILQAMALDEDLPEKPEDKTIPRYKQIHNRAGEFVVEWGLELENQYRLWQKEHAGQHYALAKRPAANSASSVSKRVKTEGGDHTERDEEELRRYFEKGELAKLTVAQLKDFIQNKSIRHNVRGAGKKADFVDIVEAWFENKGN